MNNAVGWVTLIVLAALFVVGVIGFIYDRRHGRPWQ